MPCRSDYQRPTDREEESKRVAEHLLYVEEFIDFDVPDYVRIAAIEAYGDESRLDDMTALLCKLCKDMTEQQEERIIYDGRIPQARRLADWWEHHQSVDREREAKEAKAKRIADIKAGVMTRLTDEEIEALGLTS